jgi:hypothetical protein
MDDIFSAFLSIVWFVIASIIVALPIISFFKGATVKTHIEGEASIIRYLLKGSENSPGCSDFLLYNGFTVPLTKEYMKILKKSDPNRYDSLIIELNIIINRERLLRINSVHG